MNASSRGWFGSSSGFLYTKDSSDFKIVCLGEIEVPLIVARDCHHGTCPVSGDYEITSIHRYSITTHRIDGVLAEEHSLLLLQEVDSLEFGSLAHSSLRSLRPPLSASAQMFRKEGARVKA